MRRKQSQGRSSTARQYHTVKLGNLNAVNPACDYMFPTEKAALRFAENEHAVHPKRVVIVQVAETRKTIRRFGDPMKKKPLPRRVAV